MYMITRPLETYYVEKIDITEQLGLVMTSVSAGISVTLIDELAQLAEVIEIGETVQILD